jgi:hypothetical protein
MRDYSRVDTVGSKAAPDHAGIFRGSAADIAGKDGGR